MIEFPAYHPILLRETTVTVRFHRVDVVLELARLNRNVWVDC